MRQRRAARPALIATAVAVLGCSSPRPGGDAPGPAATDAGGTDIASMAGTGGTGGGDAGAVPEAGGGNTGGPQPSPPARVQLDVRLEGMGRGRVTSADGRLICPPSCTLELDGGVHLVLEARPDEGDAFAGWTGGCTGRSSCSLDLGQDTSVTARFERRAVPVWSTDVGVVGALALDGDAVIASTEINEYEMYEGQAAEPGQRDRVIARHDLATGQRRWSQRYRSVIASFWSIDMGGLLLTAGGQLLVTGTFTNMTSFGDQALRPVMDGEGYLLHVAPSTGAVMTAQRGIGGKGVAGAGTRVALASSSTLWRYAGPGTVAPAGAASSALHSIWAVAADALGGIYGGGSFVSRLSFGTRSLTSDLAEDQAFVVKIGADDQPAWAVALRSPGPSMVSELVLDPSGDVLAVGTFQRSLTAGSQTRMAAGGSDVFVARLAGTDGQLLWLRALGDGEDDFATSITVTSDGTVYAGGGGNAAPAPTRPRRGFLASLSASDGSLRWWLDTVHPSALLPLPGGDLLVGTWSGMQRLAVTP
jgi:hypothetical protein